MFIEKIAIINFRGISTVKTIHFDLLNVIIGRNDAGKSSILKALDFFLNETTFDKDFKNNHTENPFVEIELFIKPNNLKIIVDETIETTFESEELVNDQGLLQIKKVWDSSKTSRITPDVYIKRKIYNDNDFFLKTEAQLIALCTQLNIETQKANGEEFNNVEKREKIRIHLNENRTASDFIYEKIPTSGTSRLRNVGKEIKDNLPRFEYFRADTSLSETDTAIQNFFKSIAFDCLKNIAETENIEQTVRKELETVLSKITEKINLVVPENEQISPTVEFDWTKLVKTSFSSNNNEGDLPLSSRGDGFRRITMMSYFEYLAEQNKSEKQNIVFGFEEPETFLHPKAQENLFEKFIALCSNGYQLVITTHSPIIVSQTLSEDLIHITKENGEYNVNQKVENLDEIAKDIGITVDNQFIQLFDRAKVIIFVEGADDTLVLNHIAGIYKDNGLIPDNFDDLGVVVIPTGGCGSIKHWVTLDLIDKLGKPFIIFQDSDKKSKDENSPTKDLLLNLGLVEGENFIITKKRELENYIPFQALNDLCPGANLEYGDYDDVKELCLKNNERETLGKDKVLKEHFVKLDFNQIRSSFYDGNEDEFLILYKLIKGKL
jgi:putative ATP-dependent endonuclease of OLD family